MKKRHETYKELLEEVNNYGQALFDEGKSETECKAYELNAKLTLAIYDFLCRFCVVGTLLGLLLLFLLLKQIL